MGHIGIIAEYNPFHTGHMYQIGTIKKAFPNKNIVVCMSGNYVQRGEPAIFPMQVRTECALTCGADLVIGLPSVYSSSSSELFAAAGVLTLWKTGLIDILCFGAECDNIDNLTTLANLFLTEPDNYKVSLKKNLSKGLSFPKARAFAVAEYFDNSSYTDILRHPNNILAIDYIKAIMRYDLPIKPYVIKRSSDNHSSLSTDDIICSSSAIRNSIYNAENINISLLRNHIPEAALDVINNSPISKPLFWDDFYHLLEYRLLSENKRLSDYYEVSETLANSIDNITILPQTFNELINILSGKQITNSRIRRCMLNIMLGRTKEHSIKPFNKDLIDYIRILGVKGECTYLLKEMKSTCSLPVINKTSNYRRQLRGFGLAMFEHEIFENNLYRQVFYNKYGNIIPTDYQQSVIIK